MGTQISAPIRIVALLGVLAAAAVGAYTFTQGPAGSSAGGPNSAAAIEQQAKGVAARLSGHNVATAQGKPDATTTAAPAAKPPVTPAQAKTPAATPPTTKPAVTAKPAAVKPAAKPAAAKPAAAKPAPAKHVDSAKTTIAALLRTHKVVVVLLYDPQAKVDQYSLAEAQLGARESGAGFIGVDVLSQHAAAPFTKAYGVLQDPSLLFFERPGKLALKLTGFNDHDVIAQAVSNIAPKLAASTAALASAKPKPSARASNDFAAWQDGVNAACRRDNAVPGRAPPTNASEAERVAYIRGLGRQGDKMIAQVSAVALPSVAYRRAEARTYIAALKRVRSDLDVVLRGHIRRDVAETNKGLTALSLDNKRLNAMSQDLGLTDCL